MTSHPRFTAFYDHCFEIYKSHGVKRTIKGAWQAAKQCLPPGVEAATYPATQSHATCYDWVARAERERGEMIPSEFKNSKAIEMITDKELKKFSPAETLHRISCLLSKRIMDWAVAESGQTAHIQCSVDAKHLAKVMLDCMSKKIVMEGGVSDRTAEETTLNIKEVKEEAEKRAVQFLKLAAESRSKQVTVTDVRA